MKTQHLRCSWALSDDSKHNEASFSTTLIDLLYLRVAQMSRCSDLVIFMLIDGQTLPLAHAIVRESVEYKTLGSCMALAAQAGNDNPMHSSYSSYM
jgi:hypothetical protein